VPHGGLATVRVVLARFPDFDFDFAGPHWSS
jgi:hypothetical protein